MVGNKESFEQQHRRIVSELNAVGEKVASIDELVNTKRPYPKAIPVLAGLLPTISDWHLKSALVRSLTVKEAAGSEIAKMLINEFNSIRSPLSDVKWAIGNAMTVIASEAEYDSIAAILRNRSHGIDRQMFAVALGRLKSPEAVPLLIEMLSDEDVAGHAVIGLGTSKSAAAVPAIEPFRRHPKAWIRKEAERALRSIAKASGIWLE